MISCQRFGGKIVKKENPRKEMWTAELWLPSSGESEPQANRARADANGPLLNHFVPWFGSWVETGVWRTRHLWGPSWSDWSGSRRTCRWVLHLVLHRAFMSFRPLNVTHLKEFKLVVSTFSPVSDKIPNHLLIYRIQLSFQLLMHFSMYLSLFSLMHFNGHLVG